MNNEKLQKNIDEAKSAYSKVSLSLEEKENLRKSLFDKIDSKPTQSPFFDWSFYAKAASLSFAAFVIFTSPLVVVAQRSLPGEFLYELKTNVNEEVVEIFIPKEKKEDYKKSLMTKRAFEIKTLSEKGELGDEQIKAAEKAMKKSVSEVISTEVSEDKTEEEIIKDHKDVIAVLDFSQNIIESRKVFGIDSSLEDLKVIAHASLMIHVENISENDEEGIEGSVDSFIEDMKEIIENIDIEDIASPASSTPAVTTSPATTTASTTATSTKTVEENATTTVSIEATSISTSTPKSNSASREKLERVLELYEDVYEKKVQLDVEKLSREFLR